MRTLPLLILLAITGCTTTYQLTLMSRSGGDRGQGTYEDARGSSGPITVSLGGRTYTGTWVATRQEGTGFITSYGRRFSGLSTVHVNSWLQQGLALLTAPNGATLRCEFQTDGGAGFGNCEDNQGKKYDLQMLPVERR